MENYKYLQNGIDPFQSPTDPNGWYTGTPDTDAFDVPEQDVDDL